MAPERRITYREIWLERLEEDGQDRQRRIMAEKEAEGKRGELCICTRTHTIYIYI